MTAFDLVLGNPPYQELKEGNRKTRMIWQDHLLDGFGRLRDGGKLAMIHPSTWRDAAPTHPKEIGIAGGILKSGGMEWLKMVSMESCGKVFRGVSIPFDVHVTRKGPPPAAGTLVEWTEGEPGAVRLGGREFIVNFPCRDLGAAIAAPGEERVDFLFEPAPFFSDREWMSDEETGEFRHPCVYSVSKDERRRGENGGGLTFHWSSTLDPPVTKRVRAMFGTPKVIFGTWNRAGIPHVDAEGRYGMTQQAGAIVDDPGVLPDIARAMDSARFRRMMDAVRFGTRDWNRKIIAMFRRDFWRDFL